MQLVGSVGYGAFASVYHATVKGTNESVAIKVVNRGGDFRHIKREIINHSKMNHPQIIGFREVCNHLTCSVDAWLASGKVSAAELTAVSSSARAAYLSLFVARQRCSLLGQLSAALLPARGVTSACRCF